MVALEESSEGALTSSGEHECLYKVNLLNYECQLLKQALYVQNKNVISVVFERQKYVLPSSR